MTVKRKQLATLLFIGMLCISAVSLIGCKKKTEPAESAVTTHSEMTEQKMCPIMDAPVNKEFYTEYQGKKVYFCCPGCEDVFLKNPEDYLDKLPQFQQ